MWRAWHWESIKVVELLLPARARVVASSRFAVRLLLGCVAQPPAAACGVGVRLGGSGSWSPAPALIRRLVLPLQGLPVPGQNEPADPSDDCLRASGGRVAGGGLGLRGRGAPRPGPPARSAQASADRKQARIVRCRGQHRRTCSPSARTTRKIKTWLNYEL
jgi:hypothetical protein